MKWHKEERETNENFIIKPITYLEIRSSYLRARKLRCLSSNSLHGEGGWVPVTSGLSSVTGLMYTCSQKKAPSHRGDSPAQRLSKCTFKTSSVSITWELAKNSNHPSAPFLKSNITYPVFSSSDCFPSRSAAQASFQGNSLMFYSVKTQNFLNSGDSAFWPYSLIYRRTH